MKLGALIEELCRIRDSINDRDPSNVEVVIRNPYAPTLPKVIESEFDVRLEAFEIFPEPPDENKPVWKKSVKLWIDEN